MESTDSDFQNILQVARGDGQVFGLILKGSRGKGLITEKSDFDLNLIISPEAKDDFEKRFVGLKNVDLVIYTLKEFDAYAGWNTDSAWDRYDYVGAQVLLDKLGGRIGEITREKGTLPAEHQRVFVTHAMSVYLNATFRALKSLRDKALFSARMSIVESLPYFLDAIFGMDGRLRPYSKYLLWDIKREPLRSCPWTAEAFEEKTNSLLVSHPTKEDILIPLSILEQAAQRTGFSDVLKEWEKEIVKMRSW